MCSVLNEAVQLMLIRLKALDLMIAVYVRVICSQDIINQSINIFISGTNGPADRKLYR